MIKGIIDRFEDDLVIIEIEGENKLVKRSDIPPEAREGDIVVFSHNKWIIDKDATTDRKNNIDKLANELWSE
ncbi:MAG: DUF3006 domain-containing protein [Syntrophomonas sp.]